MLYEHFIQADSIYMAHIADELDLSAVKIILDCSSKGDNSMAFFDKHARLCSKSVSISPVGI